MARTVCQLVGQSILLLCACILTAICARVDFEITWKKCSSPQVDVLHLISRSLSQRSRSQSDVKDKKSNILPCPGSTSSCMEDFKITLHTCSSR